VTKDGFAIAGNDWHGADCVNCLCHEVVRSTVTSKLYNSVDSRYRAQNELDQPKTFVNLQGCIVDARVLRCGAAQVFGGCQQEARYGQILNSELKGQHKYQVCI
jgi:hypothetical protein